jgi:formylmethanofuran dehydrogenase subunit E
MMQEREETPQERRARWMEREAERAEEGGRKVKEVRCSRCGKEIEEFMDVRGRTLCIDCYAEEDVKCSLP